MIMMMSFVNSTCFQIFHSLYSFNVKRKNKLPTLPRIPRVCCSRRVRTNSAPWDCRSSRFSPRVRKKFLKQICQQIQRNWTNVFKMSSFQRNSSRSSSFKIFKSRVLQSHDSPKQHFLPQHVCTLIFVALGLQTLICVICVVCVESAIPTSESPHVAITELFKGWNLKPSQPPNPRRWSLSLVNFNLPSMTFFSIACCLTFLLLRSWLVSRFTRLLLDTIHSALVDLQSGDHAWRWDRHGSASNLLLKVP